MFTTVTSVDDPNYMSVYSRALSMAKDASSDEDLRNFTIKLEKARGGKVGPLEDLDKRRFRVVGVTARLVLEKFPLKNEVLLSYDEKVKELSEMAEKEAVRKAEEKETKRLNEWEAKSNLQWSQYANAMKFISDHIKKGTYDQREAQVVGFLTNMEPVDEAIEELVNDLLCRVENAKYYPKMKNCFKGDPYIHLYENATHLQNAYKQVILFRDNVSKRVGKIKDVASRGRGSNPMRKATRDVKFKSADVNLGIVGIKPEDAHLKKAILVYNTKNRRMGIYVAKEGEKLRFTRNKIENFDEKRSISKTLRDPVRQLSHFQKAKNVTRAETLFSDDYLKGKSFVMSSRFNSDVMIIKTFA